MFGQNPVRKQEVTDGEVLWVQETFHTIQGEGPLAGTPAVFIRLAGCNLKCWFCDTDFESSSWRPKLAELSDKVEQVAGEARQSTHGLCELAVLTGGEPMRQNVIPLIERLNSLGFGVQIETAGTLWLDGIEKLFPKYTDRIEDLATHQLLGQRIEFANSIVCSPKTPKLNEQLVPYIGSYKYIVRREECGPDGLPTSSTQQKDAKLNMVQYPVARPAKGVQRRDVYLQPCDEQTPEAGRRNLEYAALMCIRHGYRLSVQTHKLAGLP